ncbi:MAG: hypothetical protein IPJ79_10580 [Bacteroidetes bacterium]|nr:hypothetical protein [Bacteroidota bacterium]
MPLNDKVFNRINWKSTHIIIPGLLIILGGGFFVFTGIVSKNIKICYVGLAQLACLLLLFFWRINEKVKVTSEGIEFNSWFKTISIKWKNIKSVGGYYKTYDSAINTYLSEIRNFSIWGQRFIYVSTETNYLFNDGQKINNTFIDFHYRAELLNLIEDYLKTNPNLHLKKPEF